MPNSCWKSTTAAETIATSRRFDILALAGRPATSTRPAKLHPLCIITWPCTINIEDLQSDWCRAHSSDRHKNLAIVHRLFPLRRKGGKRSGPRDYPYNLAHQNGRSKTCIHCLETDHPGSKCALAGISEIIPDIQALHWCHSGKARSDRGERNTCICYSWNDKRCAVPYCRYRHVCARCQGEHKASLCTTYLPRPDPPSRPGVTRRSNMSEIPLAKGSMNRSIHRPYAAGISVISIN